MPRKVRVQRGMLISPFTHLFDVANSFIHPFIHSPIHPPVRRGEFAHSAIQPCIHATILSIWIAHCDRYATPNGVGKGLWGYCGATNRLLLRSKKEDGPPLRGAVTYGPSPLRFAVTFGRIGNLMNLWFRQKHVSCE